MTKRKKLLLGIVLILATAGGLTSWSLARANAQPRAVSTKYLQVFFDRYVAALNSKDLDRIERFHSANSVSVGPWGVEMQGAERRRYFQERFAAFPDATIEVKKVTFEPINETRGYITWEFGIKAGRQAEPFMGVIGDPGVETSFEDPNYYDHDGVCNGEVCPNEVQPAVVNIEEQLAGLDKEIAALDQQIASINESKGSNQRQSFALTQKRSDLVGERAQVEAALIDAVVSNIKFVRQTTYQNLDALLKKLNGQ